MGLLNLIFIRDIKNKYSSKNIHSFKFKFFSLINLNYSLNHFHFLGINIQICIKAFGVKLFD